MNISELIIISYAHVQASLNCVPQSICKFNEMNRVGGTEFHFQPCFWMLEQDTSCKKCYILDLIGSSRVKRVTDYGMPYAHSVYPELMGPARFRSELHPGCFIP